MIVISTGKITIQQISVRETSCTIQWIVIQLIALSTFFQEKIVIHLLFFVNCKLFTYKLANELTTHTRLVSGGVNIIFKASLATTQNFSQSLHTGNPPPHPSDGKLSDKKECY